MNTFMNSSTNGHAAPVSIAASGFDSFAAQTERKARDAEIKSKLAGVPNDVFAKANAPEAAELQQQPALVIGIGGSGHKIGALVKLAYVQSKEGKMPERVSVLCFDSAKDPISYVDERTGKIVALQPGAEFIEFEAVHVAKIKRYRERHPEVYNTFGAEAIDGITRAVIEHGAAQDRIQGALAGTFNASVFEREVKTRLHQLTERRRNVNSAMENMTTLRVFLVLSMAGGQGSGFGLIAAAIINRILEEMSTLGERGKLTLVLLLPDAFYGIENEQMRANTKAFVEELNAVMLGRVSAHIEYPGGHPLDLTDSPVSDVYVLGGIDEAGMAFSGADDVCALAARQIWLLSSSVVGMQEINAVVNQTNVLLNVSDGGYGTYLATAGHATIRFPAQDVVARCAAHYAAAVLHELVQKSGATQPATNQARAADPVGITAVRERLSTDADGRPYATRLVTPKALQELPERDIPTKATVMADNHLQRRIEGDVFGQINQKAAELLSRLQEQLTEHSDGLVMSGKLHEALAFVMQAQAVQEQALAALRLEQEDLAKKDEIERQALAAAGDLMDKSKEGFLSDIIPGRRRAALERALQIYAAAASNLAQVRVERKTAEQSSDLLRKLGEWLVRRRQTLETITNRLELAQNVLHAYAADLSRRSGGRTEIRLHDEQLVNHLYEKYAGKVDVDASMVVSQARGLQAWLTYKPHEIARSVLEAVTFRYEPILQLTVEDVLALRWNERSAHEWHARLESLAAAAWNPDRALLRHGGADLARYLVLGVPDATRSLFDGAGRTLVSTHDPERIIALVTVYGSSFDSLRSFVQWERAYDTISRQRTPHIFRWFQRSEDRTHQIFALGLIYGLIRSQGAWYSYQHADALREPVRLAQGLEKSIAAFSQMHELQMVVDERVQAEAAKEGKTVTFERINTWINSGPTGSSVDETLVKLRRAARDTLADLVGQTR